MKAGGGKRKGSAFERDICRALSLWVTAGKHNDVFWRTAVSGGRATTLRKRGQSIRQTGDICAVAPEGHALTNEFYIENKFVRDLSISNFILKNTGPLANFWRVAKEQAELHGRSPMLIARQNHPNVIIVLTRYSQLFWPPLLRSELRDCNLMLFNDLIALSPGGLQSNA